MQPDPVSQRSLTFMVALRGMVVVAPAAAAPDAAIEEHLDDVMRELDGLQAVDSSIDLDLSDRSVRFEVLAQAANPIEAVNVASAQIRSAIHAAGGATPDWPTLDAGVWGVQLIASSSTLIDA